MFAPLARIPAGVEVPRPINAMPPSKRSEPADLQAVLDAELAYIHHHRHGQHRDRAVVQRSLIGLALSGGGIRSATTNLGILQALAQMRILPMVDYLSTVSGGGYIGAWLSSLLSWNSNALAASPDPRAQYVFAEGERPAFSTGHGASKKMPPNA